ncbi:hypothetical protein KSB_26450 [Ktedonobacter robiniae]|uniref:Uncharacterized protein n=1 Tax=Ktedonobacter robiniae TaxID=2778365 RepID=A0ABQ3UN74_9CHLR|nr:hypothetical protein KSB_26450 [Ktedonobacter robiniae]
MSKGPESCFGNNLNLNKSHLFERSKGPIREQLYFLSTGGGLTINIVALLDKIAGAVAGTAGKAEDIRVAQRYRYDIHNCTVEATLLEGQ